MRFGLTDGRLKTLGEIGKVTWERSRQVESKTMSKLCCISARVRRTLWRLPPLAGHPECLRSAISPQLGIEPEVLRGDGVHPAERVQFGEILIGPALLEIMVY